MENRIIREITERLSNVPEPIRMWSFEEDEEANLWVRIPGHDLYIGNMEGTSKCCFDLGHFIEHSAEDIDTLLGYIEELKEEIEDLNYDVQELNDEIAELKE